jgi:ABC-type transporter Mla subunit MlaD
LVKGYSGLERRKMEPKRRKTDKPRVDIAEDGELVVLESLTEAVRGLLAIIKLIGFLLFAAIVFMAGLAIFVNQIENKVTQASNAADNASDAASETRVIVSDTKTLVEKAIEDLSTGDTEQQQRLQEVFDAVFNIEDIVEKLNSP